VAAATQVTVTWKDRLGKVARVVFYVAASVVDPDNTIIKGIIALMEAIARAKATQIEIGNSTSFSGTAGQQSYSTCEDKAQLAMLDSNGKSHNFKVPGLKASILDTDHERVKTESTPTSTLLSDISTYCCGSGGSAITSTTIGKRLMRKRLKH
jgi:hypothetical protein